jgi:hypothetical protein
MKSKFGLGDHDDDQDLAKPLRDALEYWAKAVQQISYDRDKCEAEQLPPSESEEIAAKILK